MFEIRSIPPDTIGIVEWQSIPHLNSTLAERQLGDNMSCQTNSGFSVILFFV